MNVNKNLDLARKAYPYDNNLRVTYMLGLEEGYNQAMQDIEVFLNENRGFVGERFTVEDIVEQFKNHVELTIKRT
ncbi:MAG: hypothetical protein J6X18_01155 [Bacteroidales bacterium]|nr:hypothetical protein [Bacteroidales bacterium]